METTRSLTRLAPQGWAGLLLLAVCWPLNWTLPGLRTAYLFFPLWLGYILVMDALVRRRTGTSLWTRSRREFAWLFVLYEALAALSRPAHELICDHTASSRTNVSVRRSLVSRIE